MFPEAAASYRAKLRDPAARGAVFLAVCRGKASEGLDFADAAGRAVVITGLPYAMKTDPKARAPALRRSWAAVQPQRVAGSSAAPCWWAHAHHVLATLHGRCAGCKAFLLLMPRSTARPRSPADAHAARAGAPEARGARRGAARRAQRQARRAGRRRRGARGPGRRRVVRAAGGARGEPGHGPRHPAPPRLRRHHPRGRALPRASRPCAFFPPYPNLSFPDLGPTHAFTCHSCHAQAAMRGVLLATALDPKKFPAGYGRLRPVPPPARADQRT